MPGVCQSAARHGPFHHGERLTSNTAMRCHMAVAHCTPAAPPQTPVRSLSPAHTHRARFAQERAFQSIDLAREALGKGLLLATLGYLDEAVYWHTAAQALEVFQ